MVTPVQKAGGKRRIEQSVSLFLCPSRRGTAILYPYVHGSPYFNTDRPAVVGRNDYAANSGNLFPTSIWAGPTMTGTNMPADPWAANFMTQYTNYSLPVDNGTVKARQRRRSRAQQDAPRRNNRWHVANDLNWRKTRSIGEL